MCKVSVVSGNNRYHFEKLTEKQAINLVYPEINRDNLSFKTVHSSNKLIKTNETKTDKNKSGVHKLSCGLNPKVYIGQTGGSFLKRVSGQTIFY